MTNVVVWCVSELTENVHVALGWPQFSPAPIGRKWLQRLGQPVVMMGQVIASMGSVPRCWVREGWSIGDVLTYRRFHAGR
jgi:hypothetical protein